MCQCVEAAKNTGENRQRKPKEKQMKTKTKMLWSGVVAWVLALMSQMNVYLLSLDGVWSNWSWPIVLTAFVGACVNGLKDLGAFLSGTPVDERDENPSERIRELEQALKEAQGRPQPREVFEPLREPVRASQALNIPLLRQELREDEGVVYKTYKDHLGHLTGGIGHLILEDDPLYSAPVGSAISMEQVDNWFSEDVSVAIQDARSAVDDFEGLPRVIKHVLVNMAFNLGGAGLRKFKRTLALINQGRYAEASQEALNSRWATQVPRRAERLTSLMASADGLDHTLA